MPLNLIGGNVSRIKKAPLHEGDKKKITQSMVDFELTRRIEYRVMESQYLTKLSMSVKLGLYKLGPALFFVQAA